MKIFISLVLSIAMALLPVRAVYYYSAATAGSGSSPGTTNLLAFYNLENANDSHSGAHNLSTLSGSPTYTTGKINNGLFIDSSECIYEADAAWQTPSGSFSISVWVSPTTITPASYRGIIAKFLSAGSQVSWELGYGTTGLVEFGVSTTGTSTPGVNFDTATTSTALSAAPAWNHICAVFEASTSMKVYINGSLDVTNSTGIPSNCFDSTANFTIGSYNGTGFPNNGTTDLCGIWDRVLTSDEITWLYNSGNGRQYSDL